MRYLFILLAFIPVIAFAQPNTVNVGTAANDGTGDPLRTAMQKLNANDAAAYDSLAAHRLVLNAHSDSITKHGDSIRANAADIAAIGIASASYTTCPYNDTTYITIGSTTTDISFFLHYVATRDMTFVLTNSGTILVQYDDVTNNVYYSSEKLGASLGLTIEAEYSGTDIRLMIIVDNSLTNPAYFDYRLISKLKQ